MSLKMEFIRRATAQGANVSALCREYNITRTTGHKWISRFKEQGYDGLEEQSRRPRSTPLATGEDLVVAVGEPLQRNGRPFCRCTQKIGKIWLPQSP